MFKHQVFSAFPTVCGIQRGSEKKYTLISSIVLINFVSFTIARVVHKFRKKLDYLDNPLICDCDLAWYENWLAGLKDRDDEMMQKKRTICTMVSEHREYSVAKMPLDKMSCKRKPGVRASSATNVCPLLLAHYITFAVVRYF